MKSRTRNLVFMALLIACSYLGASIKVFSSIAFDSMPAFLAALLIGPIYGAVVGAVGHFLTALTSGFPQGMPIHLIIMISMALTVFVFGKLQKDILRNMKKYISVPLAVIVAVLFNGPVTLLMITPITGWGIFVAMLPILIPIAAVNVIAAELVYSAIPLAIKDKYQEIEKACK